MSDTRPLTDPERRYLEWWLKHRTLGSGGLMDFLLASCGGAGCITIVAYVLLAPAWKALASQSMKDSGELGVYMFVLPFVIWLGVLFYGFVHRRKRLADSEDPRKLIREDLAGGIARIHRFRATAVMLAYADHHRERNYFVRLEDNRVLFLGGWRPPGCRLEGMNFLSDEKGFPSTTFEIAATPNFLLILDVVGTGEYLRPVDEFELRSLEPKKAFWKLYSGTFIEVAWDDLRKTFG